MKRLFMSPICPLQCLETCINVSMTLELISHRESWLPVKAVAQRCFVKTVLLEILQNSQENTCARVFFLIKLRALVCNFIKKESLALVFLYEFCEIFKNNYCYGTSPVAAFVPGRFSRFLVFSVSCSSFAHEVWVMK